jgi:hypothetical protein
MTKEERRYEVSSYSYCKEFSTYKGAFNFYMKIRDTEPWLSVFDRQKQEYLIKENC